MLKFIKNYIVCKIKGHTFVSAGSCPVTNKTYTVCTRCSEMVGK